MDKILYMCYVYYYVVVNWSRICCQAEPGNTLNNSPIFEFAEWSIVDWKFTSKTHNSSHRCDPSCMVKLISLPTAADCLAYSWAYRCWALLKSSTIVHFGSSAQFFLDTREKRAIMMRFRRMIMREARKPLPTHKVLLSKAKKNCLLLFCVKCKWVSCCFPCKMRTCGWHKATYNIKIPKCSARYTNIYLISVP